LHIINEEGIILLSKTKDDPTLSGKHEKISDLFNLCFIVIIIMSSTYQCNPTGLEKQLFRVQKIKTTLYIEARVRSFFKRDVGLTIYRTICTCKDISSLLINDRDRTNVVCEIEIIREVHDTNDLSTFDPTK